jgi:H+/gluconate symporter-like permease
MGALAGTIITLAGAGVISAFAESICEKVGKPDYAQFIRLTGFAIAGVVVINTTVGFFKALRQI